MKAFDFTWMVGRKILEVKFGEPDSWLFKFGEEAMIRVQCPWRVLIDGTIRISSDDDKQQYGLPAPIDAASEATSVIQDSAVASVQVRSGTSDLWIDFADHKRLEIIPFSRGYESWEVIDPFGNYVVAQGGGQLATWKDLF